MIKQFFSSRKKTLISPFDSSSKKKYHQVDRFIPHSVSKNLYTMFDKIDRSEKKQKDTQKKDSAINYSNFLEQNLIVNDQFATKNSKLLHFGQDNMSNDKENVDLNIETITDQNVNKGRQKKVAKQPYKILEAPMLKDDFYLNLVDWSDSNQIAVGLQSSLFLWSGCTSKVKKVYESRSYREQICSVNFMKHNSKLCMGSNEGKVKIFDLQKSSEYSCISGLHTGRIGSLGCTNNLIITGSKDGYVSIQDYRMSQEVFRYKAHQQEISGLKICPNNQMIATGGNDNMLLLFSLKKMDKIVSWNEHNAAVKAIDFNPKHPSIASGGGTADKKIRIFSLHNFEKLTQIDTGSQICNMKFSPVSNELVTTHGYSLNQIILWKWDQNCQLTKIDSLMGHKNRVLYLAGQREGRRIVTGAGDQQLRLWKIFDQGEKETISYDLR